MKIFCSKKNCFTLAEILITLGIIGVVAAMTIPTLLNKINDAELNIAWKKEYSVLSSAIKLLINDNGGNIKGVFTDTSGDTLLTALSTNLKIIKYCPSATAKGNCWVDSSNIKNFGGGTADSYDMGSGPAMILSDGAFVTINWPNGASCDRDTAYKKDCGWIIVDVNGLKQPNIQGRDIFWIYIDEDYSWPAGALNDYMYKSLSKHGCDSTDNEQLQGWGCSASVVMNNN